MTDFDFDKFDREEAEDGPVIIPLTPDMLRRRVLWDMVPCHMAPEVILAVGLQPASIEVEETEHQECHARLSGIWSLAPVLDNFARYAAEAASAGMMVGTDTEVDPNEIERQREAMTPLIFQAMASVLAELNDVGLIHLAPVIGIPFE